MDYIQILIIPAAATIDCFAVGTAAGVCPCFKKRKIKSLYWAVILAAVHGLMFAIGNIFSLLNSFFKDIESLKLYPFILMLIGARLLYRGLVNNKSSISGLQISFLIVFATGIDAIAAGFSIEGRYLFKALFFCVIFSFIFSFIGYFISRKIIVNRVSRFSPDFACGGILFSAGLWTLIV